MRFARVNHYGLMACRRSWSFLRGRLFAAAETPSSACQLYVYLCGYGGGSQRLSASSDHLGYTCKHSHAPPSPKSRCSRSTRQTGMLGHRHSGQLAHSAPPPAVGSNARAITSAVAGCWPSWCARGMSHTGRCRRRVGAGEEAAAALNAATAPALSSIGDKARKPTAHSPASASPLATLSLAY